MDKTKGFYPLGPVPGGGILRFNYKSMKVRIESSSSKMTDGWMPAGLVFEIGGPAVTEHPQSYPEKRFLTAKEADDFFVTETEKFLQVTD